MMLANVLFWVPLLLLVAVAKLVVPLRQWRTLVSRWMTTLAAAWITCNGAIFRRADWRCSAALALRERPRHAR